MPAGLFYFVFGDVYIQFCACLIFKFRTIDSGVYWSC